MSMLMSMVTGMAGGFLIGYYGFSILGLWSLPAAAIFGLLNGWFWAKIG
jgi:hypothetical protein